MVVVLVAAWLIAVGAAWIWGRDEGTGPRMVLFWFLLLGPVGVLMWFFVRRGQRLGVDQAGTEPPG